MNPVTIAVNKLILCRKFTVARQGPDLTLVKVIGKRPVTIKLKSTSPRSFWVENPERDDRCVNSFFDFTMTPKRVTRNKDFFKINSLNKKAKKTVVLSLFESIRY
jgi:hypothetical protein